MDAKSFLEALVTQYVLDLLRILGFGMTALVAFLKAKFRTHDKILWGDVVLSGLWAFTGVTLVLFALTGRAILAPSPVTPENVDKYIKAWFDEAAFGPRPRPHRSSPDTKFGLEGHIPDYPNAPDKDRHAIVVERYSDAYVTVFLVIKRNESQKAWETLKKEHAKEFQSFTDIERTKISELGFYSWPNQDASTDSWTINKDIRIHEGMQDELLDVCERLNHAALIVEHSMGEQIKQYQAKPHPAP
jgi:hypothetical protein